MVVVLVVSNYGRAREKVVLVVFDGRASEKGVVSGVL